MLDTFDYCSCVISILSLNEMPFTFTWLQFSVFKPLADVWHAGMAY